MSVGTDWGAAEVAHNEPKRPLAFAVAPLGILILIMVVMGSIFLGTWGIVVGALAVGCFVAWVLDQPRRCLARAGAVPLDGASYPRPHNVVDGLAPRLGIPRPDLYLIDEGGPNALVSSRHGGAIALTRTLVEGFSRTELEAVLAHCLVRLRAGSVQRATTKLAFGPFGRMLIDPVGASDDVAAAAVTRYPPALISAIEKAQPRANKCAPLWFVPERPAGRDPVERIEALSDL